MQRVESLRECSSGYQGAWNQMNKASKYTQTIYRTTYVYAITAIGALTCAYIMKNRSWTLGLIGGGFLVTAIALAFYKKSSVIDTPEDVKKYEATQTKNEKNIESLKESEQIQISTAEDIESNLSSINICINQVKEKIKQAKLDTGEALTLASNINKVAVKWEKYP